MAFYPTLEVACGDFDRPNQDRTPAQMIELTADSGHDPATLFVAFARGDSMDGGINPIRHGDPLLLQWATGSREDYIGQVVVAERFTDGQTAVALKRLDQGQTGFQLVSENPDYPTIRGEASLRITARLIKVLTQGEINPLATHIGRAFLRAQIPPLYGQEFNPGNWNSGHVSLVKDVLLFITLDKSGHSADYTDHFESPDELVWSSQNSVGPDNKKGREILEALNTGTQIHLWIRSRKSDLAFEYRGLAVPLSSEGERPMSVRFRLLTSLDTDAWQRFRPTDRS